MNNIIGLVLCGGESSRMGKDKSMLIYFDKPQCYYIYDLLKPFCDAVYISCNKNQTKTISENYNTIVDLAIYENIGPMAALLSAFALFPNTNLLVIACDYPFFNSNEIKFLIDSKSENDFAVSLFNSQKGFEEPLLAIYSKETYKHLLSNFNKGNYSLRFFLKEINAKKINPISSDSLININTEDEYIRVKQQLKNNN